MRGLALRGKILLSVTRAALLARVSILLYFMVLVRCIKLETRASFVLQVDDHRRPLTSAYVTTH